jgi:hypothetical protein
MLLKKVTLAALAGTVLLAAAPAFADQGRGDRQQFRGNQFQGNHFRGNHFQHRPVIVHRPAYGFYEHRPVVVQRPAYGYYAPRHDVLGGLILGTVIGAAIANHDRY